jgi:hypothetical protein
MSLPHERVARFVEMKGFPHFGVIEVAADPEAETGVARLLLDDVKHLLEEDRKHNLLRGQVAQLLHDLTWHNEHEGVHVEINTPQGWTTVIESVTAMVKNL